MRFINFLHRLKDTGLTSFGKYYSNYEGEVVSNEDPENLGRLKVKVPSVAGNNALERWALPKGVPSGNQVGFFLMPNKGDNLWIEFIEGNPRFPIWNYGWWSKGELMDEASPKVQVWQSTSGHRIELHDQDNKVLIRHKDGKVIEINSGISLGSRNKSAQAAVLGNTLHVNVTKDNTLLKALKQAIINAPVAPMDGGALFKSTLIAAISPLPPGDYTQILSEIVSLD